jgi:hypothetical protein
MGVFDNQIALAERLITKYGELTTYNPLNNAIADPTKPWIVTDAGTPPIPNIRMVFLPDDFKNRETERNRLNENVTKGNTIIYLWYQGFIPRVKDTIIRLSGTEVVINRVDEINPNGEVILYEIKASIS